MKDPRSFCYWLQGLLELQEDSALSEKQVAKIKEELDKVFTHTPNSSPLTNLPQYSFLPQNPTIRC